MRTKQAFLILALAVGSTSAYADKTFSAGDWTLTVDESTGAVDIDKSGRTIIAKSIAQWGVDSIRQSLKASKSIRIKSNKNADKFGKGIRVTVSGNVGRQKVNQNFYLYDNRDYMLTDFTVSSPEGVKANYMAPIASTSRYEAFSRPGNNILFIPYDNDAWVRYRITPFGERAPESYEVTAILNSDTRQGIILGSIEHDVWKTGISAVAKNATDIDSLSVYGGAWSKLTRDVRPHGTVKGRTIKSPKIMVGAYEDWRDGMEAYADLCATVAPKIPSLGARPFGWNSWGKLQTKVNYDNATQVADFMHDNLQDNSFVNADGTLVVGLDAFWDFGLKGEQRRQFVKHCKANGQKAGIYYCPFTDWAKNPEATVSEAPQYKMKDLYLYHNGQVLQFDGAYALDPTHPGTKARIERQLKEFIDWGYEYVKVDFMAHGAYESDSHFNPDVHTGTQAFNEGMAFLDSVADGKLWINLSIAPLFPANYAHSRRIGCDAWADINNTEYSLNALTYGWWLDRVYHYNDADHIVMEGVTEGENRARLTSSAITGVYLLGDDLSETGNPDTKNRVKRIATNPDINEMARTCKSFRPVETGNTDRAADMFYYNTGDTLYVAVFNFNDSAKRKSVPMHRLGLSDGQDYKAIELWSHDSVTMRGNLSVEVPAKDVKVFRFNLK